MADHVEHRSGAAESEDSHGEGKLRVIIIGGSIAGLSCAHALLKSGVCSSVTVLEKARSLSAAGAGLGLDQLSCQALEEWGLRDGLCRKANLLVKEQNRAIDPETGVWVTLSRDDEFHHQAVHWSDLHRILYESLPSGVAHFGHEVISLAQNEDGSSITVSVSIATGGEVDDASAASTSKKVEGDIVVGADGSMSRTRKLYSSDQKRRYSGYCAWRGVLDYADEPQVYDAVKEAFPEIGEAIYFELARDSHSVLYELTGKRLNWLWYVNQQEPALEGKSVTKRPDEETIAAMHDAADRTWAPALAGVMKLTPKPFINAIYDKDPLEQLVWGRVVLVGEAAHPTSPHGLRSTNMSIGDARALGEAFQKWGPASVAAALAAYQSERLPSTSRQVLFSRHLGLLKQGILIRPGESFAWPQANVGMRDGLLLRNMNSFRWTD